MNLLERRRVLMGADKLPKPIYGDFRFVLGVYNTLPDTSLWTYPAGGGSVYVSQYSNRLVITADGTQYASLRPATPVARKALIQVTVEVVNTTLNGIRIIAGGSTGLNGIGNQITLNGNRLNVLQGNDSLSSVTTEIYKTLSYNTKHEIAVGIDYDKNDNRVYLDGLLVATISNANLSTQYANYTQISAQTGACYADKIEIFGA